MALFAGPKAACGATETLGYASRCIQVQAHTIGSVAAKPIPPLAAAGLLPTAQQSVAPDLVLGVSAPTDKRDSRAGFSFAVRRNDGAIDGFGRFVHALGRAKKVV